MFIIVLVSNSNIYIYIFIYEGRSSCAHKPCATIHSRRKRTLNIRGKQQSPAMCSHTHALFHQSETLKMRSKIFLWFSKLLVERYCVSFKGNYLLGFCCCCVSFYSLSFYSSVVMLLSCVCTLNLMAIGPLEELYLFISLSLSQCYSRSSLGVCSWN